MDAPNSPTPEPHPAAELHLGATAALSTVVDAVDPADWDRPSPCEGWTARDVLAHLIATERDFLEGRGFDPGEVPDTAADPAAAWRQHLASVTPIVTDPTVLAVAYDGYFGPTTVGDTWERFYVFDQVVHRWDLATAVGRDERFDDAELDRLEVAVDAMGDSVYLEGVCVPGVEAADPTDRQARLLARLGRRTPSDSVAG